ncbi:hypothetical protein [Cupriavidus sp. AcVe19-6a]|uniref:hypothetical protein n=1 Tax=Cupriavidus sp. AcVe19-6a TaxID=2821358 RepID=UPI001AE64A9C|nr:hypothetical protein [Cupriavidus sp. AcVe19-6a]MBP0640180.1 hypothetical protein [Cupriavidus sp. AcVe19-6a]
MIDEAIARRQSDYSVDDAASRLAGIYPGEADRLPEESDEASTVRYMRMEVLSRIETRHSLLDEVIAPLVKIVRPPRIPRAMVCQIARDFGIRNDLLPIDDDHVQGAGGTAPVAMDGPPLPRSAKLRLLLAAADAVAYARTHADKLAERPSFKKEIQDYLVAHASDYGPELGSAQIDVLAAIANIEPAPGRPGKRAGDF